MTENEKFKLTLSLSITSLAISFFVAVSQHYEKANVTVADVTVDSADLVGQAPFIEFSVDGMVSNASQPTFSLIRSSVYYAGTVYDVNVMPELPLSLAQGYAERFSITFKYPLTRDAANELLDGKDFSSVLSGFLSVRFTSGKNKMYSGSIAIKRTEWDKSKWLAGP